MANETEREKRKIHRSPSYPVFDLAEAIQKADAVYGGEKRSATTADVVASHLGYSKAQGPGGRAVSALRQYGLLEDTNGKCRISDRGYTLIQYDRNSREWRAAAKEAATLPTLFHELADEYSGGLPSDATLRNDLLRKGFNPGAIQDVVSIFRSTMSLAGNEGAVYNSAGEEVPMRAAAVDRLESNDSVALALNPAPGFKGSSIHSFSWPLSKDMTVEVRFSGTGSISAAHFERLRKYLELAKETWADEDPA